MPAKYIDERLSLPTRFTPGKIGVVTVLYNSGSVLEEFFESLDRQLHSNFVVYCVDNASTDDSVPQCKAKGSQYIVIENGSNLGVAAGNNIGTRAAVADGCEFILYLNNDVVFGPELFAQLVEGLDRYECSMTTPTMYYYDRPEVIWAAGGYFQPWLGYRCLHSRQGEMDKVPPDPPTRVSYTPTCCVLVRRELFSEIGMMDERYFVYYDDTDFMLRAWKCGKKLYLLPQAKLLHKVSTLIGTDSAFRTRYVRRNHALYIYKGVFYLHATLLSALYCFSFLVFWLVGRISRQEAFARVHAWREGAAVYKLGGGQLVPSEKSR